MKIRIKRKNKKPLEEAAAGPQDLDDSTKLICTDNGDEIKIKYSGKVTGYIEAKKLDTSGKYACYYNDSSFYYISDVEVQKEGGWGPMLYDVLMEYVWNTYKSGLTADRERVSGDAIKVWDYYFEKRSDVEKVPLDINNATKKHFGSKLNLQNRPDQSGNSECDQISSVEHAAGSGDWMSKKLKNWVTRRNLARKNAEQAVKWHEESISYGFFKTDSKILSQLGDKFVQE
tara:strand:- start:530 stop:1219 length:690 start_codon:yes stop_codon:yes gene_type:complete